jgi:carbonic anhydrase
MKDLEQGNKDFINKINNNINLKELRDNLVKGQHPEVLVITCSDSRVVPEFIFNASLGDIFVIRTAGNVINDGELATVEYAIEHLKVKRIIVLGHTHCGAVHATIKGEKGKYMDPILNRIKGNIGNVCDELEASKINATKEASYIKERFPEYKGLIEAKIYDIETSLVY